MSDYFKKIITLKELENEPGARALINEFRDNTDPKYIGPGTWNIIHRRAFKARTHEEQIIFIEFMKDVCYGFPCIVCKGHCTEYIKNHPLEEYLDMLVDVGGSKNSTNSDKIPLGIFVWTWKFHNAVNARIKKPIMSWDTAYNLYSQTESLVCSKNCLATANDDAPPDGLEHSPHSVPLLPEFKISAPSIPVTEPTPFRLVSIRTK